MLRTLRVIQRGGRTRVKRGHDSKQIYAYGTVPHLAFTSVLLCLDRKDTPDWKKTKLSAAILRQITNQFFHPGPVLWVYLPTWSDDQPCTRILWWADVIHDW